MANNDKLDTLIKMSGDVLVKKNLELFENTDTSNVVRPKSLDRRVKRTIARENRKKEYGEFYRYAKVLVASLIVVFTVSFAAVTNVDAGIRELWDAIVNFYNDFISVMFEEQTKAPETLEEKREPTLIPDEWEKRVLNDTLNSYGIRYFDDGEKVLTYFQSVINIHKQMGDNEHTDFSNVTIGEYKGVIFEYVDKNYISLKWSDKEYCYFFTCDLRKITKEQLIEIAKSVE